MKPLPNVRKLFLPDPGHIICDCDLSGADAQVVAWEAKDEDLKAAFKSGLDIHDHNGRALWGERYSRDLKPRKYTMRDELKRAVHGTNYAGGVRTIGAVLGWSQAEVRSFQDKWFKLHPGIKEWHHRVERDLNTRRQVANQFGYRIVYFDRPDNLLPKGLAWIPQSTVATICGRHAVRISKNLPWLHVLIQVHDSIVFQIPNHRDTASSWRSIQDHLRNEVPYKPEPLSIPWGLATSKLSWGEVKKVKWESVL